MNILLKISNIVKILIIQKFDKILTYSNKSINIYTIRLLFHKTISKTEYNKWVNDVKYKYEGNITEELATS